MCSNCNTATYNMECINCFARWVLRKDKADRLHVIENNGRHDIETLKKLITKLSGAVTR